MALGKLKDGFARVIGRDADGPAAADLYTAIVEQARRPVFYTNHGVPDTVEGRYDLLTLHVFLVLRRLKTEATRTKPFAQALFDAMFRNMDDSLREMGVGDLKVGKKVRELAESFYGRLGAYERAMEDDGGDAELRDALARNVLDDADADAAGLAAYTRAADALMAEQALADLRAGRVRFPDPTLFSPEETS